MRKKILLTCTIVMLLTGIALASLPFILSMEPSAKAKGINEVSEVNGVKSMGSELFDFQKKEFLVPAQTGISYMLHSGRFKDIIEDQLSERVVPLLSQAFSNSTNDSISLLVIPS